MFLIKGIEQCSHVFNRTDAVKLEPPYSGPYEIIQRQTDRVYLLKVNDKEMAVSVDRLKPAFFIKDDNSLEVPQHQPSTLRTYEKCSRPISKFVTTSLEGEYCGGPVAPSMNMTQKLRRLQSATCNTTRRERNRYD
ncbi:hypothetical protein ACLKA7_002661 [Drosophila subpalustris]